MLQLHLLEPLEAALHGKCQELALLAVTVHRVQESAGWDTPYVHNLRKVLQTSDPTSALGAPFGGQLHVDALAEVSIKVSSELRSTIVELDHAPTELVLTRQCADVSKRM